MDDNTIVNLFWERNEKAIERLSDKYGSAFMRVSYNILNNKEDAEECVNSAYYKTWKSIPDARPRSLFAYVGKIVRSLSIDLFKRNTALKRGGSKIDVLLSELNDCVPSGCSVEKSVELDELSGFISDFLRSIKQLDRVMFLERYFNTMSVKDIADKHGVTYKNVESILYRSRVKLKEYLTERGYYI